jgi:hypothetical protein
MTYHYLITLSWCPTPHLTKTKYVDGLINAWPGDTRQSLVKQAIKLAKDAAGANDTAAVVFLSIEPNELSERTA